MSFRPAPLLATLLVLLAGGCGGPTPVTPLAYAPTYPQHDQTAAPVLAMREVVDTRQLGPRALGTAQGDLGLPRRSLVTPARTVAQVDQAFTGAMLARGLLAPTGRQHYDLSVRLVRLDAHQMLTQTGTADLTLTVRNHATNRIVYADEVIASVTGAQFPSLDSLPFVPAGDVTADTQRAMNQAIDTALDKPAFRAALRG